MSLVFVLGLFAGCEKTTSTTEPQGDTTNVTAPSTEQEAYTKKAATTDDIKAALLLKNETWKTDGVTDVSVSMADTTEFYAWGSYSTSPVNKYGTFYAFNSGENKRWEIIYSGNDDPACEGVKAYSDFSVEWMPKCKDEKGESVARTQG